MLDSDDVFLSLKLLGRIVDARRLSVTVLSQFLLVHVLKVRSLVVSLLVYHHAVFGELFPLILFHLKPLLVYLVVVEVLLKLHKMASDVSRLVDERPTFLVYVLSFSFELRNPPFLRELDLVVMSLLRLPL